MNRYILLMLGAALVTAACTSDEPPEARPDLVAETQETQEVKLVPKIYWIKPDERDRILFRVLDAVNAVRLESNLAGLTLSSSLNAAARTHSRDMSVQNRPWHFGSDGSSPIDRAQRAGFDGRILGENISESFESDLETLVAWMDNSETRKLILDADARRLGIGWHQESGGKIWWTLVIGT